jgi:hypothetical protein
MAKKINPVSYYWVFLCGRTHKNRPTYCWRKEGKVMQVISKIKSEEPKSKEVFCAYIIKGGKKIYPKHVKFFHFFVNA